MENSRTLNYSICTLSNLASVVDQVKLYLASNSTVETLIGDVSIVSSEGSTDLGIIVVSDSADSLPDIQKQTPDSKLVLLAVTGGKASVLSPVHRLLAHLGYQVRSVTLSASSELSPEQLALVLSDVHSWVHIHLEPEQPRKHQLLKVWRESSTFIDQLGMRFAEAACLKRAKEDVAQVFEAFPVALTHARLSPQMYQRARDVTKIQNEIWMKMAFDLQFLLKETEQLAKEDDFVAEFVKIVRKKAELPPSDAPDFRFAISRNDFMIEPDDNFYQVEFNLIASGMGPISQRHQKALQSIDRDFGTTDKTLTPVEEDNEKFLADSLAAAHQAYGVPDAVIVLVCDLEKNAVDQWAPSDSLAEKGIHFIRYSFADLEDLLVVDPHTRTATILGKEVALFYFRDGYLPTQYTPERWRIRETLELSKAIKCPDATLQLINMKYFQLVLNRLSTWTHFGYSEEVFKQCQATFCNILTVDDFEGDKAKMKEFIYKEGGVKNWVLKPQREGGANNFFDEDIITQIDTLDLQELRSFILMEKIFARKRTGVITNWKDGVKVRPLIDEIGIFQTNVFVDKTPKFTVHGGTLVRSKVAGVNEGGVGMGFAVINSIALE